MCRLTESLESTQQSTFFVPIVSAKVHGLIIEYAGTKCLLQICKTWKQFTVVMM